MYRSEPSHKTLQGGPSGVYEDQVLLINVCHVTTWHPVLGWVTNMGPFTPRSLLSNRGEEEADRLPRVQGTMHKYSWRFAKKELRGASQRVREVLEVVAFETVEKNGGDFDRQKRCQGRACLFICGRGRV